MASSQVSPSAVNSSNSSAAICSTTTTTSTTGSNSGAQQGVIITNTNNNNSMDDMSDDAPNGPDPNRWFFEKERLETTPSRKCGIDPDKELMLRQQSANFIQDMGQRLHVNQLCINTAIVYMHRFYMYHSFSHFHQNHVSTAAIFLAAKVEEQPRKLEHVIKVAHYCLNRDTPQIDTKSEAYAEQAQELVMTENILLQTLGFDVAIDHPHAHVVKCCQLVRASKDLAQTSYFMATNSLHLTTMCLQYKPTVVACVCIHLTCKWSNWEIPRSKEGRDWFWYVDDTVTMDQLEKLTTEFLAIFDKSPSRLKKKILSLNQGGGGTSLSLSAYPTLNMDPKSPQSQSRSSPATSSHPSSNQALKRSSVGMKPSSSQIGTKQAKVNGGIPHHSVKPPHSSQIPPNSSSSSSSKHPHYSSSSGSKGMLPPGSHHGAKDAHSSVQSHSSMKPPPPGHHHSSSSSSSGHPPPNYPHSGSSSSGSSSRPSSHPVHHSSSSSSSNNPSSHQSASQVSKSSHALPGHPPGKPPHPQPSKVPYNYNIKSQIPSSSSSSSTQPIPKPAPPPSSSSSSSQQQQPSSKVPPHFPQPPQPAYNQKKQGPYPPPPLDPSSRRDPAPDFNGKRESGSSEDSSSSSSNRRIQSSRSRPDQGKPDSAYSTSGSGGSSNLPPVSLPFNAATTSEPGRLWPDNGTGGGGSNTSSSSMEPRIPPGRTSLFSPDPDLMESSSFISSTLGTALKPELSPIGDLSVGAKGASGSNNNNNNITGGVVGDGDSSADSYFAVPSAVSSSVFPNLFEFTSGSSGPSIFDSSLDLLPPLDSINSMPLLSSSSSAAAAVPLPSSVTSLTAGSLMKTDSPTRRLPENSVHEDEPPHKKVKKAKKEKHKHKDKDRHEEKRERKDKEEKKHKDKNRDKSRGDEGTTTKKHKEKHKKDKHKEKGEREKSGKGPGKYPGEMMLMDSYGGPDLSATNRLKINLGSSRIEPPAPAGGAPLLLPPQQSFMMEKSKSSKHSSKKHKSNLPSSSSSGSSGPGDNAAGAPPGIKLKIVPPRPPTLDDGRL